MTYPTMWYPQSPEEDLGTGSTSFLYLAVINIVKLSVEISVDADN